MTDIGIDHIYLSTACFHELHEKCRKSCKFCAEECVCLCHVRKYDPAGEVVQAR